MTCTLDVECDQNEVCSQNQCSNPCEHEGCGMNSECQCHNHMKDCSCPVGFTGNPAVECVRSKLYSSWLSKVTILTYFFISVPVACTVNSDCSQGHTCRDLMCLPHCLHDQECALNEKCLNGNCMRKFKFL